MKIGDKVKCVKRYSHNSGKTGIVVGIKDDGKINVYFTIADWEYGIGDLELVEEANYIPVPKFKIGDIVWFKARDEKIYNGLVVKGRDSEMNYKLFVENYPSVNMGAGILYLKAILDTLVDIKESELSKEKPE